jgi:hypothetical protein
MKNLNLIGATMQTRLVTNRAKLKCICEVHVSVLVKERSDALIDRERRQCAQAGTIMDAQKTVHVLSNCPEHFIDTGASLNCLGVVVVLCTASDA